MNKPSNALLSPSQTCYVGGGTDVGICCELPVPLQTCPGGQQCKLQGQCNSPGALNADGSYTVRKSVVALDQSCKCTFGNT